MLRGNAQEHFINGKVEELLNIARAYGIGGAEGIRW